MLQVWGHEHIHMNASPVISLLLLLCCAGERTRGGEWREGNSKKLTRSIGEFIGVQSSCIPATCGTVLRLSYKRQ